MKASGIGARESMRRFPEGWRFRVESVMAMAARKEATAIGVFRVSSVRRSWGFGWLAVDDRVRRHGSGYEED